MDNKEPKYLTNSAKEGDIYYFIVEKKYYFLKIIKIDTRTVETKLNGKEKLFCYYIIVFEKSYSKLPTNRNEMDFVNVYRIKYKPKNTLLYITCEYNTMELKIDKEDALYKTKELFNLHYWLNEGDRNEYIPKIIIKRVSWTENENKILVSPTGAKIGYILDRIIDDIKYKNKKILKVSPKYFSRWINEIDTDIIIKVEKILNKYLEEYNKISVEKSLKKCIKDINKLDKIEHFIGTIEAENIFDTIMEISKGNYDKNIIEKIINENREW
jgi:hypothetical protein